MNPDYVFGSELLAVIAPPPEAGKTVTIDVERNFDEEQRGYVWKVDTVTLWSLRLL